MTRIEHPSFTAASPNDKACGDADTVAVEPIKAIGLDPAYIVCIHRRSTNHGTQAYVSRFLPARSIENIPTWEYMRHAWVQLNSMNGKYEAQVQ